MEFRKDNPILLNSIVILLLLSLCVQGLAQNCSSLPCLNGGTCQDSQDGFICDCPTQPLTFIGPTCAKLHEACEAIGCSKNYTCHSVSGHSEYQCTCTVGSNCSSNMCEPNPCALPNFQCIESEDAFICRCQAGYFGANCEKVMNGCTQNPCQNNGSCSAQTGSYTCACKPGYTGQHCEVDINECSSNPCQNDAICVDKVNKYLCFCVPGFQGYHCEIDINECASRPCFNNGTCINQMDQYECDCATGYTGVNCETEINECESDPCQNGATCKDHIGYFSCDCPAGYEGELCQQDIDECQSQPCQNGGICVDDVNRFNCNCSETGFAGDMCEIDIPECASNPCLNNATCIERVKRYDCHCWPGYSGDHCYVDINECLDGPCENGALCLERSNQSFYGKEPEFSYDFRYSQAAGYVCRCRAGFTGENCSVDIDECESEPCQNDGSCADLINGFMCNCAPGFTGLVCSIDIDDCESNPCENGATCTDAVDDYYCGCLTPALDGITWGGKNCSIQLEGCRIHSCQNQAVCIPKYEENIHSYICKCQPGFYGENCTIQTTFSFTSNGYILYDLHSTNRSKRHTDSVTGQAGQFSVRFRTTLPNMILMYRGNEDNYLILELYNGLLHLQFWRNSTHLVLSHHRLDDGYWHKVKVLADTSVQLILHHEDCANGICSTEEIIKNAQLPESFNTVYIGGLAEEALLNNTISRQNFTGCMEDLEIDSMIQLPQNFNKLFEMELGCNKTDWCHPNPCHYGALCIDLWASMRCECIRPYRGPTCMQEYTPGTFSKEGVPSYASFTVAQGIGNNFNISAFIRTLKPDGLLLAVSNVTEDYFQLFLRNGWLHVSIVSATPLIFKEYLSDGKTYFINISMKEGLVTMNHLDVETRLGHLPNVSIESRDEIFIGGLPENDHLGQQGGYFKGCLQDIRLNNHRLEFFKLVTEDIKMEEILYPEVINNVTMNCESDPTCDSGPCKNGGDCTVTWNDFTCSCPTNFTGRTCEEPVWCESKPCPSNTTCQDVPGGYVCVADVTFLGDHPVVFASNVSTDQQLTSVSLAFRTRDRNAVLLNASKDMDSIFIAIHNGYLQVTLQSGNSVEHVQYAGRIDVSDAVWHKIVISMKDPSHRLSQWTIQLDNDVAETPQGTAGSLMFLTKDTMVVLAENYTGCLGQVTIGGIHLPFIDNPFPQQFVRDPGLMELGCKGTDVCSKYPCFNDGECQDLFNSFSCVCRAGWEGKYCETDINECNFNNCTHGFCEDLVGDYKCICDRGYTGRKCETDVDDCQNHQCQNGGTCIDGVNSYTCKCLPSYTGEYCQWPYPPEECIKNVTCLNGGKCNNGIWGANCTCRPGFTGKRCEVNIDDCESNPCLNGGTCQDSVNNFKCICISNYSGVHCEKDIVVSIFPFPLLGIAVPVLSGVLLLLVIVVIFMVLTARKRRQSEGTYSPSQQEVAGARLEMDSVLKVPPEERLI